MVQKLARSSQEMRLLTWKYVDTESPFLAGLSSYAIVSLRLIFTLSTTAKDGGEEWDVAFMRTLWRWGLLVIWKFVQDEFLLHPHFGFRLRMHFVYDFLRSSYPTFGQTSASAFGHSSPPLIGSPPSASVLADRPLAPLLLSSDYSTTSEEAFPRMDYTRDYMWPYLSAFRPSIFRMVHVSVGLC